MSEPKWYLITRWAPLFGSWNITTSEVEFVGQPGGPQPPVGICASDVEMNEGNVKVHASLTSVGEREDSAARILFGFRSPDSRYLSVGIGGYKAAFVLSEFLPTVGWRAISAIGLRQNLSTDHPYELTAQFLGQRVTLKVDGVRVIESVLDAPIQRGQVGLFCWGLGNVKFRGAEVLRGPGGSAFVVMELSEPYQHLYEQVIKPTARRYGLNAHHAGEVYGPGIILQDIVSGLINSQVVIAEITPANQNVFYELGYAHALGKPTILLAERGKDLPFDVSGYRCVFYDNTIAGKTQIELALSKHLRALFGDPVDDGNAAT